MATVYTDNSPVMDKLMAGAEGIQTPAPGSLVEGTVISVSKNKVLVDIDGLSTGVIAGQEAHDSSGTIKSIKPGDEVSAYILEEENEDGLVVLSLRKASQEKTWHKFVNAYETGDPLPVSPTEANKGGLLLNVDGIKGFIPVSQLAPLHYPRVDGADSNEILNRLQKLVGQPLNVKVINLDSDEVFDIKQFNSYSSKGIGQILRVSILNDDYNNIQILQKFIDGSSCIINKDQYCEKKEVSVLEVEYILDGEVILGVGKFGSVGKRRKRVIE